MSTSFIAELRFASGCRNGKYGSKKIGITHAKQCAGYNENHSPLPSKLGKIKWANTLLTIRIKKISPPQQHQSVSIPHNRSIQI